MAEYMTLLGAEQVGNAAREMRGAADEMQRAAMNIEGSFERHQRFLDDWLQRFETALAGRLALQDGEGR